MTISPMRSPALRNTCIFLALVAPCAGQTKYSWVQRKPATSPPGTHRHAMCFDTVRGVTVLFGGGSANTGSSLYNTTWEWDGSTWSKQTPKTSPSKRHTFGMAFCPNLQASLVFGGHDETSFFNDTWSWDGKAWTRHTPSTSPTARRSHLLVADTKRRRIVLFGGNSGKTLLNDTWEWNGKTWAKMSPKTSPPVLHGYAIAYDQARQRTVLFGGAGTKGNTNETWEWDGSNWTRSNPKTSPAARGNNWMVYDSVRQRTVLFAGSLSPGNYSNETWVFDGVNWSKLTLNLKPAGRDAHAMVFDAVRQEVVLFAGIRARSDTWSLIHSGFSTYGIGCAGTATPPSLSVTSPPRIGRAFSVDIANLKPLASGLLYFGASDKVWNGLPLPLDLTVINMKGCKLLVSMDAALGFFTQNGGTWSWKVMVPSNATFIGVTFFNQAWVLDSKANPLGIATSNGGKGVVGF